VTSTRSFRCKAILFDLDGVLVNSAELVERTWRVWAARHQLDAEKVIAVAHGRRTIETVRIVAPHLSVDAEVAALESSEIITSEGVYEIPGARELLEMLPSERWAVVTSGIRAVAEFRIRHTGLPMPSVMICADDISRGKPDPEGYLAAAMRLGQPPKDCIVIEDAPAGIEAAHNGGMRAIAVAATYPAAQLSAADLVVERLADLTSIVWDGEQGVIEVTGRPAPVLTALRENRKA
jgi:sugar-phosphatase